MHSSRTLNIPSITQLYNETHALTHISTRLKGDSKVNKILDRKIERESEWKRKASTVVQSEALFHSALAQSAASSQTTEHLSPRSKLKFAKNKVKQLSKEECERKQVEHAKQLMSQGHLLQLLQEMELDATWKSYLFSLPKGTLKFIINSSINTLPTRANLKLWGSSSSDKCKLCGRKETTNHILSSCPTALQQGRYTYRHNRVLEEITDRIDTSSFSFYSDLKDHSISGGTVPPEILVTAEKPDIVIIDNTAARITGIGKSKVIIIELTCPWEERLEKAREHKTEKYSSLIHDIQATGHEVAFIPLEIGVRGIINRSNKSSIREIAEYCRKETTPKQLTQELSKQAVTGSYFIFLSRNEKEWNNN